MTGFASGRHFLVEFLMLTAWRGLSHHYPPVGLLPVACWILTHTQIYPLHQPGPKFSEVHQLIMLDFMLPLPIARSMLSVLLIMDLRNDAKMSKRYHVGSQLLRSFLVKAPVFSNHVNMRAPWPRSHRRPPRRCFSSRRILELSCAAVLAHKPPSSKPNEKIRNHKVHSN